MRETLARRELPGFSRLNEFELNEWLRHQVRRRRDQEEGWLNSNPFWG